MEGIHDYIIQIEKPLKDTIKFKELELHLAGKTNQSQNSNRLGTVISVPPQIETPIEVGYQVMIIPTILLKQTYKGEMVDSSYLMDQVKGYYRVPNELIVLYRADENAQWQCNYIYVLVEPIEVAIEDKKIGEIYLPNSLFESDVTGYQSGNIKQWGTAKYVNADIIQAGLSTGDKVYFKDFGEYEFEVDGEILYCMDNEDVLVKEIA